MKRSILKMTAAGLCVVLTGGSIAFAANALQGQESSPKKETETAADVSYSEAEETGNEKDETVYVLAGADGAVKKIIVSDWLKNALGSQTLRDRTELTDVENVKGEEGSTLDKSGVRVWDAQGSDIYYQGNIQKELPVDMAVSYKLDGKDIAPSDLEGKSGKVTIRFDYTNRQYEEVEIDGKKEKIYVPFAVLTGVLLDNDVFTNIEVSNGRLVNDGSRTAVAGIAFPGLQENLALSEEKLEIPDYVEITGDAKNFKLGMTITLATNELFNDIDADEFNSADELSNSVGKLKDAMSQLLNGSSQLYDGLSSLLEQSGKLVTGIDQLAAGAQTLKSGAGDLDEGAVSLQAGAAQLSDGLNTLAENNESLNGGAKQVFETLLSVAHTQLADAGVEAPELTIENYGDVLAGVIASLDTDAVYEKALAAVTSAVEEKRNDIQEQVAAAVRKEVNAKVTAAVEEQVAAQVTQAVKDTVTEKVVASAAQMDMESYEAAVKAGAVSEEVQAAVEAAIREQMQSGEIQQTIEAKTAEQMETQDVQKTIEEKVSEQMQSDTVKETVASNTELQIQKAIAENMASEKVQEQLAAATEGAKAVISLKTSLDSYHVFYQGLQSYTAGVSKAAAGAGELKEGTNSLKSGTAQLSAGAAELSAGAVTLNNSMPALVDGITSLKNGSMKLSDGLKELNEQGIKKLTDAVDGDLKGLMTRLRATKDVSARYKTFAGADAEMDGQVKFIYRTESIGE